MGLTKRSGGINIVFTLSRRSSLVDKSDGQEGSKDEFKLYKL